MDEFVEAFDFAGGAAIVTPERRHQMASAAAPHDAA
jgi:hypothetical protein